MADKSAAGSSPSKTSPLPAACPSPHAEEVRVGQGVVEALLAHEASTTDDLERLEVLTRAGEEIELGVLEAKSVTHPRRPLEEVEELEDVGTRRGPREFGVEAFLGERHGGATLPTSSEKVVNPSPTMACEPLE